MRRRQVFQAQQAQFSEAMRELVTAAGGEVGQWEGVNIILPVKGQCPKCARIFPKGLHLHTRSCKGSD
jgi:hypothetical protein